MANRFSPSVLPRRRPGVFGALLGLGTGVARGFHEREARHDRQREQAIREAILKVDRTRPGTATAEPDPAAAQAAIEGALEPGLESGVGAMTLAERALAPLADRIPDNVAQLTVPHETRTLRERSGVRGAGTPIVPETRGAGGPFGPRARPRDAAINRAVEPALMQGTGAVESRLPGDVRTMFFDLPEERLPLGKEGKFGTIANPDFQPAVQRQALFEALIGAGRSPDEATIATIAGVPSTFQEVAAQGPNDLRIRQLIQIQGAASAGGMSVEARQNMQNTAEALAHYFLQSGQASTPEQAVFMAGEAIGFTPSTKDVASERTRRLQSPLRGLPAPGEFQSMQEAFQAVQDAGGDISAAHDVLRRYLQVEAEMKAQQDADPNLLNNPENRRRWEAIQQEVDMLRNYINSGTSMTLMQWIMSQMLNQPVQSP